MQIEETVKEYENERNEVSNPWNVGAEGGTTPCSSFIENMIQKTKSNQQTKGVARTYILRTKE